MVKRLGEVDVVRLAMYGLAIGILCYRHTTHLHFYNISCALYFVHYMCVGICSCQGLSACNSSQYQLTVCVDLFM